MVAKFVRQVAPGPLCMQMCITLSLQIMRCWLEFFMFFCFNVWFNLSLRSPLLRNCMLSEEWSELEWRIDWISSHGNEKRNINKLSNLMNSVDVESPP